MASQDSLPAKWRVRESHHNVVTQKAAIQNWQIEGSYLSPFSNLAFQSLEKNSKNLVLSAATKIREMILPQAYAEESRRHLTF